MENGIEMFVVMMRLRSSLRLKFNVVSEFDAICHKMMTNLYDE